MDVISLIERETVVNKGCTYSLVNGELVTPGAPLYALSLHKELEEVIPLDEFDGTKIRMFLIKNSELLWQPMNVIGTWVDSEQVYIDVTTLFDKCNTSLQDLKELATDQLAGWDIELNKAISL